MKAFLVSQGTSLRQIYDSSTILHPHRHRYLFSGAAAVLMTAFTVWGIGSLRYFPASWVFLLSIVGLMLWVAQPTYGLTYTLAIFILPLTYHFPFPGGSLVILLVAVLVVRGMLNPYSSLWVALGVVALLVPGWSWTMGMIPFALGFQGRAKAIVGAIAAVVIMEVVALLGGRPGTPLLSGVAGAPLVISRPSLVKHIADVAWVAKDSPHALPAATFAQDLFLPFAANPILIGQMIIWATTALIVALVIEHPLTRTLPVRVQAIGLSLLFFLIADAITLTFLAQGFAAETFITQSFLSALVIIIIAPILDVSYFALSSDVSHETTSATRDSPAGSGTMAGFAGGPSAGKLGVVMPVTKSLKPTDRWEDLAGISSVIAEVREAIASQFDPKTRATLAKMGIRPTRGILLFGPTGTGKTRIARAIANEIQASFFSVSGTEFTSKWVGESEANLRRIFEEARKSKPAVLFFDEIEAFLPRRSDLSRSDAPEKGVIATFLAYADGVADLEGVLLLAATNYPNLIEPAVLRPGRFDKLIYVGPPDLAARRLILDRYLPVAIRAADVDIEALASKTERYTGADLQLLCENAKRRVIARHLPEAEQVTMADLEAMLAASKPSVTIKMLREYEEIAEQYNRRSEPTEALDIIEHPQYTWDDVAGMADTVSALRQSVELPMNHPEVFAQYGIHPSKGVLLYGPPGCGKTFLAKVVAGASGASFLSVKGPEILNRYVGQSEENLRAIFNRARENVPAIIFFDEIDAIALERGTDDPTATRILTQLLTEMDGFEELKGVMVIAATNRPDILDKALMRPGRFDRLLYISPPDHAARAALFQRVLKNKPVEPEIDFEELSELSEGYSVADILALCNAAAMQAALKTLATGEQHLLTNEELRTQIQRTTSSLSPEDMQRFQELRDRFQR